MSNIVNVGIEQSGVEGGVAKELEKAFGRSVWTIINIAKEMPSSPSYTAFNKQDYDFTQQIVCWFLTSFNPSSRLWIINCNLGKIIMSSQNKFSKIVAAVLTIIILKAIIIKLFIKDMLYLCFLLNSFKNADVCLY